MGPIGPLGSKMRRTDALSCDSNAVRCAVARLSEGPLMADSRPSPPRLIPVDSFRWLTSANDPFRSLAGRPTNDRFAARAVIQPSGRNGPCRPQPVIRHAHVKVSEQQKLPFLPYRHIANQLKTDHSWSRIFYRTAVLYQIRYLVMP